MLAGRFMFVENPTAARTSGVKEEQSSMEIIIFNDRVKRFKFDKKEFDADHYKPLMFEVSGRTIGGIGLISSTHTTLDAVCVCV